MGGDVEQGFLVSSRYPRIARTLMQRLRRSHFDDLRVFNFVGHDQSPLNAVFSALSFGGSYEEFPWTALKGGSVSMFASHT
jgi:hypothetical protein